MITGEFGSAAPFVFRGANGDLLICHYGRTDFGASTPGTFELTIISTEPDGSLRVQGVWSAQFVPVPGQSTGKFLGVTGSGMIIIRSAPFVLGSSDPVSYSWEVTGSLKFAKK